MFRFPPKRFIALLAACVLLTSVISAASEKEDTAYQRWLKRRVTSRQNFNYSSLDRAVSLARKAQSSQPNGGKSMSFRVDSGGVPIPNLRHAPDPASKPDLCFGGDEDCSEEGFSDNGPGNTQSELSIAVDATGMNIVIGYNDFRGFSLPIFSLSGVAYSNDGGKTFTDGGQLPVTGPEGTGQVFGDPSLLWIPGGNGCQFVYASIFVNSLNQQTMSIHTSKDCGKTWVGPFEVKPATIPTSVNDAADKELIALDPDTGRVLMSWSNFGDVAVEIRTTFSDNIMANPPTWSPGVVLNPDTAIPNFDTGSMPAFAGGGSNDVYVAFSSQDTFYTAATLVSVSHDNGLTWSDPVALSQDNLLLPNFFIDNIISNDRTHQFPAVAVDKFGNAFVAYATNGNLDGSDVVVHRSTDGGATWSEATVLSARPGHDRSQWFPSITTDPTTGRVWVVYDDQGVDSSSDRMEMLVTYSDDGGVKWSSPAPLTTRPFHGGFGNDTSQPNLGDYNWSVAKGGFLYTIFPVTPNKALFTDGEPAGTAFTYPTVLGNATAGGTAPSPGFVKTSNSTLSLRIAPVTFVESGGNGLVDAGDIVALQIPLSNFVTNPATSPTTYRGVIGRLTTSTPGVVVLLGISPYGSIGPGSTQNNIINYLVYLGPNFVPGTDIEFTLNVQTVSGPAKLLYTQRTGTPVSTVIYSENFDGTAAGSLPAGWTTSHGGGANTVPWTTNATFCGTTTNAAFHQNANDNGTGNPRRFERLFSPLFDVPANAGYVTIDFDTCYDSEDDPLLNVLGYDGFTLRITDQTAGRVLRSIFPETIANEFSSDGLLGFPKRFPRSSSTAYFQDISAWSGSSGGRHFDSGSGLWLHNPPKPVHVRMRIDGMAGSKAQLRFEYTQDTGGICTDVGGGPVCGVQVDNIVVRSVASRSDELAVVKLFPIGFNTWLGVVVSQASAGPGGITVNLSTNSSRATLSTSKVVIPAGSNESPSFTLKSTLPKGSPIIVTATGPSNSRTATVTSQ